MKVQLVRIGDESELCIPPPSPLAELVLKMQLVSDGEDAKLHIPPPSPPLFPLKMALVSFGEE